MAVVTPHFLMHITCCNNLLSHSVIAVTLCNDFLSHFVITVTVCNNSVSHFIITTEWTSTQDLQSKIEDPEPIAYTMT